MSPEVSMSVIIAKQAECAKQSFGLPLLLQDLTRSMLNHVYQKSSMMSNVPIILQMYINSLGKQNKIKKKHVSPFPALETTPVLLLVAPAIDKNSFILFISWMCKLVEPSYGCCSQEGIILSLGVLYIFLCWS